MAETALAFALKKAGVNTNAALLRSIAVDELRKTDCVISRALSRFTEEVRDAGGIMAELVPYATTRDLAFAYLERVAADMGGEGLKVPAKAGDGVHFRDEIRIMAGPVDHSEGEGSGNSVRNRCAGGPSPSDPVPAQAGGGVRRRRDDSQKSFGSPESREGEAVHIPPDGQVRLGPSSSRQVRDGAVQKPSDGQWLAGRVVPIPNKPRGLDAMKTQRESNDLMDTYLLLNGSKIGDLVWSSLPRLAKTSAEVSALSARQSALLKLIHGHVTPADPNARVRDLIKSVDLQRMIQKTAEIAHG